MCFFLFRMSLPYQNFGNLMSDLVATRDVGNMGNTFTMQCFIQIFYAQYDNFSEYDGFVIFMKAVFGNDTTLPERKLTSKGAHPIQTAEYFNPFPAKDLSYPTHIIDYSIKGLAKLLMYKDFVKAKIAYSNGTMDADSIVTEELDNYPYKRKEEFVSPKFSTSIISSTSDIEFHAALTDGGICQVLNGQSLSNSK